ncbi:hypothetical protein N0V93_004630 [Gnomoniopsis smithogilvyi]|uniref:Monooxygenase n=1 Tax=Gnomoniopsis smithogilvyi TaxID=1191159 RepID=A0A9W8YV16_9PEZI|nr:hypothetical protein N0V93_004630 [Gnomoniopsis smithogilvyi]
MGSSQNDTESYDIVVVGAGLAGINAAYRFKTKIPDAKIAVLEARDSIGGTWEIFKYPGIRSDSDLYTYGFSWEPWPYDTPIAEGHLILSYLHHCVKKHDLGKYMSFRHKVTGGDWSSETRKWTLSVDHDGHKKIYSTSFVVLGTGYYDYDNPLPAIIPGIENFNGKVIHPQFWPNDFDFSDKEVVVIGSGATAITLIPNLAPLTKHTTMLQRSPSYVTAVSNKSAFANWWFLPQGVKHWLDRVRAITRGAFYVSLCQLYPEQARRRFIETTAQLLPSTISTDPHFTPRYLPWEQRVCLSPDGDFFKCLHGKDGQPAKASVVTATIDTVAEDGIVCQGGQKLKTDVIITATGLKMRWGGGILFRVDGELISPNEHVIWDDCMMNDVPNLVFMLGYARASWTLGTDNTAITVCRLWKDMKKRGQEIALPKLPAQQLQHVGEDDKKHWLDLSATYLKRDTTSPFNLKNGKGPWKAKGNVWFDWLFARFGNIRQSLALS